MLWRLVTEKVATLTELSTDIWSIDDVYKAHAMLDITRGMESVSNET